MARPKSEALLEAKLEEARRLDAEIRKLRNAARDKIRAVEEQRGKVLGRVVIAYMAAQPESELTQSLNRLLADSLTKPGERTLFPDLPYPKPTEPGVRDESENAA